MQLTLNNQPYNFVLHTSPVNEPEGPSNYHWHVEFMPRLTRVAGFEWGTGFYINETPPEQAAEYLGVTVGWLAKRRVYGDGPCYVKLLGRILYDRADLDAFVERNKRYSTSEGASRKAAL